MSSRWGDGRGKPDKKNDFISSSENMFELDVTFVEMLWREMQTEGRKWFPTAVVLHCLRFFQMSQTRKVFIECQDCSPRGKMQEAD